MGWGERSPSLLHLWGSLISGLPHSTPPPPPPLQPCGPSSRTLALPSLLEDTWLRSCQDLPHPALSSSPTHGPGPLGQWPVNNRPQQHPCALPSSHPSQSTRLLGEARAGGGAGERQTGRKTDGDRAWWELASLSQPPSFVPLGVLSATPSAHSPRAPVGTCLQPVTRFPQGALLPALSLLLGHHRQDTLVLTLR